MKILMVLTSHDRMGDTGKVRRDGKLVTGQNPASSAAAAHEVLALLK